MQQLLHALCTVLLIESIEELPYRAKGAQGCFFNETVTVESKAVKDRGGGAKKALCAGCFKSLGLWCQHSMEEDRTRFDTEHFPTGQGRQSVKSSSRVKEDQRAEKVSQKQQLNSIKKAIMVNYERR
jgi:hypothetical protein